jgi:hypothetical protein
MFVRFAQLYVFWTGARVPDSQVKGPFSVNRPLSEEHPGPPLSLTLTLALTAMMFIYGTYQMTTSSGQLVLVEGKNLSLVSQVRDGKTVRIPEEQLPGLTGIFRDGQQASIRLANVEGNLGNTRSIDRKCYAQLALLKP